MLFSEIYIYVQTKQLICFVRVRDGSMSESHSFGWLVLVRLLLESIIDKIPLGFPKAYIYR